MFHHKLSIQVEDRYVPPVPVQPHAVLWKTDVHLLQQKLWRDRQVGQSVGRFFETEKVNSTQKVNWCITSYQLSSTDGGEKKRVSIKRWDTTSNVWLTFVRCTTNEAEAEDDKGS